jgi:hypothetical protein
MLVSFAQFFEAGERVLHATATVHNDYWQFCDRYLDVKWGRTHEEWLASLGNPTIQDVKAENQAVRIEVLQD